MEYDDNNMPLDDTLTTLALANITERLNDAYRAIAALRTVVEALATRMDEASHMTSDEYGQQVVEQIMAALPSLQAAAMKKTKGRRP
jgi:citrate synthase